MLQGPGVLPTLADTMTDRTEAVAYLYSLDSKQFVELLKLIRFYS